MYLGKAAYLGYDYMEGLCNDIFFYKQATAMVKGMTVYTTTYTEN